MKCFEHREREAVGICKCCSKGLCEDCAADLGRGLACKGRCEAEVQALNNVTYNSTGLLPAANAVVRTTRRTHFFSSMFNTILGVVFGYFGYQEYVNLGEVGFTAIIGAVFIVYGFVSLLQMWRMFVAPKFPIGCCQKCGYDLTANKSGTCPECGKRV